MNPGTILVLRAPHPDCLRFARVRVVESDDGRNEGRVLVECDGPAPEGYEAHVARGGFNQLWDEAELLAEYEPEAARQLALW